MANLFELFKNYASGHNIFIIIIDITFLMIISTFLFSIIRYNNKAKRKFYLVLVVIAAYIIIKAIGLPITSVILNDVIAYWPVFILILFFNEIAIFRSAGAKNGIQ